MPLVVGGLASPYPTAGQVMNAARAKVNDMINDASGDLLTNDAPYSQTYFDLAFEWLQGECDTVGVEFPEKTVYLFGIPPRFNEDTANRSSISWTGCTDGVNNYKGPALPQDMLSPKSLWRRFAVPLNADGSAAVNTNRFCLMAVANDGLPKWFDCSSYDWSGDSINFYGEPGRAQDFEMRYSAYLPSVDITNVDAPVPIMRCMNALGIRIGREFTAARWGADNPTAIALANDADREFAKMKLRSGRRRGRKNIRRQPYNSRLLAGTNNFPYYTNP